MPTSQLLAGTQYITSVHSHSITSLTGIALNIPYYIKFTTDASPKVISSDPANGALRIPLNKVIKIKFNEAIKLPSKPWIELKTNSGIAKPFKLSISGNVLIITPTTLLTKGTQYIVSVHSNSITSSTGLASKSYIFRFNTV